MHKHSFAKAYAVVLLREDMRLTFHDIAKRMGCSPAGARYLYKQAMELEQQGKKLLKLWNADKRFAE